MPPSKKITYPIFLVCRSLCESSAVKKLFEALAYGESLDGFFVSTTTNVIECLHTSFCYPFKGKDAADICRDLCKQLIAEGSTVLAVHSQEKEPEPSITVASSDWSGLRNATAKRLCIVSYSSQMGKLYSLSDEQVKTLYTLITIGLQLKFFSGYDISMCEGNIQKIKGFGFSKGKIVVEKRLYSPAQQQYLHSVLRPEQLALLEIEQ